MKMKSVLGIRLASIVSFLVLWEAVGRSGLFLPQVLPPASEVFVELIGLFNSSYYPTAYEAVLVLNPVMITPALPSLILGQWMQVSAAFFFFFWAITLAE